MNAATNKPLFNLGRIVATPGALDALKEAGDNAFAFIRRHVRGDWGDVCEDDAKENELALGHGLRILSSYRTSAGEKLWLITEYDRSQTTLLLPSEY